MAAKDLEIPVVAGKRQPGQRSPLPRPATALDHLVVTHMHPLLLKDVDTRKLAINLPCRRTSRKLFTWLPSAAGLFGQLSSHLRTHILQLACTYKQPFRIHAYRGRGKLSHLPYRKNNLTQIDNARALSAVSKAIRRETSQVFYQVNSFSIDHDPYCPGNDAISVLKRFRDTIGEEAFLQIRSFSFTTLVTNVRAARTLPSPQDTGIQITEALKAMVIAAGTYCIDTQSVGARVRSAL
ncbi:hypothetical protein Slin15195_G080050 [Septoria linicola]|uniref:Uncharacterized protein n=1 Tax=Septoria linicola TaxID=215465 RepID=A0A9Q9B1L5_9PEZI|nr:hypothetical protein Slin15195_G080050 [Septoria linicola]